MNLLFVCSGNTCRSPLALASWQMEAADFPALATASTAGLTAWEGSRVSPHSLAVAKEWGADLAHHHARRLSEAMVYDADLICVMTTEHAAIVRAAFPDAGGKVHLLADFIRYDSRGNSDGEALRHLLEEEHTTAEHDILDPYGGSLEAYRSCGLQIRAAVRGLVWALQNDRAGSHD